MKTVAIIPARGGSKGIPRKNLYSFSGKPLIYWNITAALQIEAGVPSADIHRLQETGPSHSQLELPGLYIKHANLARSIHGYQQIPH